MCPQALDHQSSYLGCEQRRFELSKIQHFHSTNGGHQCILDLCMSSECFLHLCVPYPYSLLGSSGHLQPPLTDTDVTSSSWLDSLYPQPRSKPVCEPGSLLSAVGGCGGCGGLPCQKRLSEVLTHVHTRSPAFECRMISTSWLIGYKTVTGGFCSPMKQLHNGLPCNAPTFM